MAYLDTLIATNMPLKNKKLFFIKIFNIDNQPINSTLALFLAMYHKIKGILYCIVP